MLIVQGNEENPFFIDDELYAHVDKWGDGKVPMAKKLPSSYEFPGIENRSPVFGRWYVYDNRGINDEGNN